MCYLKGYFVVTYLHFSHVIERMLLGRLRIRESCMNQIGLFLLSETHGRNELHINVTNYDQYCAIKDFHYSGCTYFAISYTKWKSQSCKLIMNKDFPQVTIRYNCAPKRIAIIPMGHIAGRKVKAWQFKEEAETCDRSELSPCQPFMCSPLPDKSWPINIVLSLLCLLHSFSFPCFFGWLKSYNFSYTLEEAILDGGEMMFHFELNWIQKFSWCGCCRNLTQT